MKAFGSRFTIADFASVVQKSNTLRSHVVFCLRVDQLLGDQERQPEHYRPDIRHVSASFPPTTHHTSRRTITNLDRRAPCQCVTLQQLRQSAVEGRRRVGQGAGHLVPVGHNLHQLPRRLHGFQAAECIHGPQSAPPSILYYHYIPALNART
jgi:hypothetical protein